MSNQEATVSVFAIVGFVFLLCFVAMTARSCQDRAGFERDECREKLKTCAELCR